MIILLQCIRDTSLSVHAWDFPCHSTILQSIHLKDVKRGSSDANKIEPAQKSMVYDIDDELFSGKIEKYS